MTGYIDGFTGFINRDGNERTSLFMAIWNAMERLKTEQEVDVYHTVELIRMIRPQAIIDIVSCYKLLHILAKLWGVSVLLSYLCGEQGVLVWEHPGQGTPVQGACGQGIVAREHPGQGTSYQGVREQVPSRTFSTRCARRFP